MNNCVGSIVEKKTEISKIESNVRSVAQYRLKPRIIDYEYEWYWERRLAALVEESCYITLVKTLIIESDNDWSSRWLKLKNIFKYNLAGKLIKISRDTVETVFRETFNPLLNKVQENQILKKRSKEIELQSETGPGWSYVYFGKLSYIDQSGVSIGDSIKTIKDIIFLNEGLPKRQERECFLLDYFLPNLVFFRRNE